MYTAAALLDLHRRSHQGLQRLLEHCAGLDPDAFDRELPGFGYPSVRLQLHHLIGAEEYWVGVLRGDFRVEDDAPDYPDLASLQAYRSRVARVTVEYLGGISDSELNQAREMLTWRGTRPRLTPAHVILRTQTHIFQHQGQILAQCRLLGRPSPGGLDFPLEPEPVA